MRATIITAACLFLLASASGQRDKPKASAVSSSKAVLEAYVSAWNHHDFAALDKLLTPDAVHEDIAWPSRDEGPAQIKKFMQGMIALEPDFDWRLTNVIDSGSEVAAEWTWTATYTGDCPTLGHVVGMHSTGRGASVAMIENGRIKRFTDYYDFASFCRTGSSAQKNT
ncbi:MAG TPA: nuclear transport factor 2 family protein [Candidatus Acidoferrales bacterium]|nr:nuclear transport factor 2 family protein [Candidatus Acidoferrales bacterium]